MMKKAVKNFITGTVVSSFVVGWWYRPIPIEETDISNFKNRQLVWMISKYSLADLADRSPPILYDLARRFVVLFQVSISRLFLIYGGSYRIAEDVNYINFVNKLKNRDSNVPMLTISNHRSLLDDPLIFSCLVPFSMNIQPKYLRYNLCSQEYCFNSKNPSAIAAYIGLGKVLPIKRGGGINQGLLLDYARFIANGNWCHVFPEAGIWQKSDLGGRQNGRELEIGKLKWGVGKLIAHAPVPPVVIPFFFQGTETIIPQHSVTKKVDSYIPQPFHKVVLRFGEEIDFNDLIEEHELKYGPLWKYKRSVKEDNNDKENNWISNENDKILYSKITKRIEEKLTILNIISNKES